jgi:hypothetical protein
MAVLSFGALENACGTLKDRGLAKAYELMRTAMLLTLVFTKQKHNFPSVSLEFGA